MIIGALKNIGSLSAILFGSTIRLYEINNLINTTLLAGFTEAEKSQISPAFKKRLLSYMFGGYFFGKVFGTMHGIKFTRQERLVLYMSGAFLGVGDALFDDTDINFDHRRILKIIQETNTYSPLYYKDKLLQRIFSLLIVNAKDYQVEQVKESITEAYHANTESEQQKQQLTDEQLIEYLSLKKGGYCGLFYRACVPVYYTEKEKETAYRLGELGQLIDDALDLQEDKRNKLLTMFSVKSNINSIIDAYISFRNDTYLQISALPLNKKNLQTAIFQYNQVSNAALFFLLHLKGQVAINEDIEHIEKLRYKDISIKFTPKHIYNIIYQYYKYKQNG